MGTNMARTLPRGDYEITQDLLRDSSPPDQLKEHGVSYSLQTLADKRCKGIGLEYFKVGTMIRYPHIGIVDEAIRSTTPENKKDTSAAVEASLKARRKKVATPDPFGA